MTTTLLSYPVTASTASYIQVTGAYTGTAPTTPAASWTTGDSATVLGYSAANGRWQCAISTPATATGATTFAIMGLTSAAVTVSAGVTDFAPGVYIPAIVYTAQSLINTNTPIASLLLRGFVGLPTVTLSGADAASFYVQSASLYPQDALSGSTQTTFALTITATDGLITHSATVTVRNTPQTTASVIVQHNSVLDSEGPDYTGLYPVSSINLYAGATTTNTTLTDASGLFTYYAAGGQVYIAAASLTKYGAYPVTFVANGNSYATTFYIGHERAPTVSWVPGINVYNNTPANTLIGTVAYYADNEMSSGGQGFISTQVLTNPTPGATIGVQGMVWILATPPTGSTTFVFSVTGLAGVSNILVTVPAAAGTTLPATNITHTPLPAITNNSAWLALPGNIPAQPLLITTLAVSGFVNVPTWTIKVLTSAGLPENCQIDYIGNDSNYYYWGCPPRYTFTQPNYAVTGLSVATAVVTATGTSGITLYGSFFSAQTDNVYLTADDGLGTRCTLLLPIAAADVCATGPAIDIGAGRTYATVNAFLAAGWAARTGPLVGATLTLHDNINTTTDYSYDNQAGQSGKSNAGDMPFPVIIRSPPGTVRTTLDWRGTNVGSQKFGIPVNNFDLTLINLQICNVNNPSSGEPNAAGIFLDASPGNVTGIGLYVFGCDMGIQGGDGTGKHISFTNCIFVKNGAPTGASHNLYVSTVSSLTMTGCQVDCTTDDHGVKSRAMVTTLTNSTIRQGAQAPGAGCPVDMPVGGIINVSGCTILSSSNPGNQYMLEAGEENGPTSSTQLWPQCTVTITGNTFLNITPPAAYDSGNAAITAIAHYTSYVPYNGTPFAQTYSNNSFYNIPQANRVGIAYGSYAQYYSGANLSSQTVDGGGNVVLATYIDQKVIDPLTGSEPVNKPRNGGGNASISQLTLQTTDPLQLDFVLSTNPGLGAIGCALGAYDYNGNLWATSTFSVLSGSSAYFNVSASGVVATASGATPNGLYGMAVQATGTGATALGGTVGPLTVSQWVPIIVGYTNVAVTAPTGFGEKGATLSNAYLALTFNGTAVPGLAQNAATGALTSLFLSLHNSDPGLNGNQTVGECVYGGYQRMPVVRSPAGFVVTAGSVALAAPLPFLLGTSGSSLAAFFAVGTLATGPGQILYTGPIVPPMTLGQGILPTLSTAITEK